MSLSSLIINKCIKMIIFYFYSAETDLRSEIEKLSEEKHVKSQKILQLEQNIDKLSKLFYNIFLKILKIILK